MNVFRFLHKFDSTNQFWPTGYTSQLLHCLSIQFKSPKAHYWIVGVYGSVSSLSGELEFDLTVGAEIDESDSTFAKSINNFKESGGLGSS